MSEEYQLNKIRSLISEHFDEYLIVVTKGPKVYNCYKSKLSAMGMCRMVEQDIEDSWSIKNEDSNNL